MAPPVLVPVITEFGFDEGDGADLSWEAEAGINYRVEYKESLGDASWQVLETITAGGDSVQFTDAAAAGKPQGFYRVVRAGG